MIVTSAWSPRGMSDAQANGGRRMNERLLPARISVVPNSESSPARGNVIDCPPMFEPSIMWMVTVSTNTFERAAVTTSVTSGSRADDTLQPWSEAVTDAGVTLPNETVGFLGSGPNGEPSHAATRRAHTA